MFSVAESFDDCPGVTPSLRVRAEIIRSTEIDNVSLDFRSKHITYLKATNKRFSHPEYFLIRGSFPKVPAKELGAGPYSTPKIPVFSRSPVLKLGILLA